MSEDTPYEWKNGKKSFSLFLRGISLADFGVPLGQEAGWVARFKSLKDPRLSSITFQELREGLKIEGKWRFPGGALELAEPKMESFEYREQSPPRLLVDFWLKKGPTLQEVKSARLQAQRLVLAKREESEAKVRIERRIATEKKRAEADDLGKFCRRPLNESQDVVLPFFPLHEEVNYDRWIASTTPDSRFYYYKPESKDRDAQYVRLALSLYTQGKFALVLRTLDFFETENPKSYYRSEMKFLRANTMIKLGMEKEADEVLLKLLFDVPDSPVALHSAMFIAAKRAKQKAHLLALESFLWLVEHYPDHRLNWLFHLGAAESLFGLRQIDQASKAYQRVLEHAQNKTDKGEAATRLGDLHLAKFQYETALADYFQGLSYMGKEAEAFPSIHLNRAESLYWLGQSDRAKKAFEEFLERYPAHPAGWRATYRLAEIQGRLGASDSRYWFTETINRYPFSPGATLARMQLIPCGDHGGFNPEAAKRFFAEEVSKFNGNGEIHMLRFPEFRALMEVRTLIGWSEEQQGKRTLANGASSDPSHYIQEAIDATIRGLRTLRNDPVRTELVSMLEVLFRKRIGGLLDQGKKAEALAFYQEKASYLPKNIRYSDPEYLLRLSQAASDLSLGKLGQELAQSYDDAVRWKDSRALASGQTEDSSKDPLQKLRVSEQKFAEAKAIWVSGRASAGSAEADQLRKLLNQVGEESPFSYERELILGLMDERQNKLQDALGHATKAQMLRTSQGALKSQMDLRLDSWVARLEARVGDPQTALDICQNLENRLGAHAEGEKQEETSDILGLPPVLSSLDLTVMQAGIFEKINQWGHAASSYLRALSLNGNSNSNRLKFGYARALMKSGEPKDREKSEATLKEIVASKEDDLWKSLAREGLNNKALLDKKSLEGQNLEIAKEGKQ